MQINYYYYYYYYITKPEHKRKSIGLSSALSTTHMSLLVTGNNCGTQRSTEHLLFLVTIAQMLSLLATLQYIYIYIEG